MNPTAPNSFLSHHRRILWILLLVTVLLLLLAMTGSKYGSPEPQDLEIKTEERVSQSQTGDVEQ